MGVHGVNGAYLWFSKSANARGYVLFDERERTFPRFERCCNFLREIETLAIQFWMSRPLAKREVCELRIGVNLGYKDSCLTGGNMPNVAPVWENEDSLMLSFAWNRKPRIAPR